MHRKICDKNMKVIFDFENKWAVYIARWVKAAFLASYFLYHAFLFKTSALVGHITHSLLVSMLHKSKGTL